MYVLDSSALIELIHDTPVAHTIGDILKDELLITTSISMHELLVGALSEKQRFVLEGIFSIMRILPHDRPAAQQGALIEKELIKTGKKINDSDIFIAGICKAHNAELVTLDNDFTRIKGLKIHLVRE